MVTEGTFPKTDGDIAYSSEYNTFTDKKLASINSVNVIQQLLNSNTPNSGVNFQQDSELSFTGSFLSKVSTVYHPHYNSGTHNAAIDEHNDASINTTLWAVSGGNLDVVDEGDGYMRMLAGIGGGSKTGSIFSKENFFDTYGPAIRINLGSIVTFEQPGGGDETTELTVYMDTVSLTGNKYWNGFAAASGTIDLLRLSGNTFLYRVNEGAWSGDTFTSGKVGFIMKLQAGVGDGAGGSIFINNEVYASGLFATQIQLSGTLPSGLYNYAIFNKNVGSVNALTGSDISADFSFNDGANFVDFLGSERQWTLNNDTGSEFIFRFKQNILHKPGGFAQGTINNFGILYGAV